MNRRRKRLLSSTSNKALIAGSGRKLGDRMFVTLGDVLWFVVGHGVEGVMRARDQIAAKRAAAIIQ